MTAIPVEFDLQGKTYKGALSPVSGAGASAGFHLCVDDFYWGQLSYNQGHPGFNGGLHAVPAGWYFSSNTRPELSELKDYFGNIVELWYE